VSLLVALHTAGQVPTEEILERWLTEQGEPFEREGDELVLRALPVRLALTVEDGLSGTLDIGPGTPLVRLVDLLFDLSVVAGADVLLGKTKLTRPALWLRLADEQDRLRIGAALDQAEERGILDEVLRRLWAVLGALHPGSDLRWSADLRSIVELREPPTTGPLGASDHGELVPVPVRSNAHVLACRWLSEAYPSLQEA
jgi:hypothetical protein